MKAKYVKEAFAKMDVTQAGLNIINLPTLVLHGTGDQLVPFLAITSQVKTNSLRYV